MEFIAILTNIIQHVWISQKASVPRKMHHSNNSLWVTKEVRSLKIKRNKVERLYLKNKTKEHKDSCRQASKQLKTSVKKAIKNFETTLANNVDVKPFWHYVKSKYKVKT